MYAGTSEFGRLLHEFTGSIEWCNTLPSRFRFPSLPRAIRPLRSFKRPAIRPLRSFKRPAIRPLREGLKGRPPAAPNLDTAACLSLPTPTPPLVCPSNPDAAACLACSLSQQCNDCVWCGCAGLKSRSQAWQLLLATHRPFPFWHAFVWQLAQYDFGCDICRWNPPDLVVAAEAMFLTFNSDAFLEGGPSPC